MTHKVAALAMCDAENCATALATQPVLSVPVRPIEEELHLQEKLYPILLQHNEMRSLADLDEPLVRATRKLVEERTPTAAPLRTASAARARATSPTLFRRLTRWRFVAPASIIEAPPPRRSGRSGAARHRTLGSR